MNGCKFIWLFLKTSNREKWEIIKYFYKRGKQKFIDYWLGYVEVIKHYVYDVDDKQKLYTISIIAGRHGRGAWLSDIDANDIPRLYDQLQQSKARKFQLIVEGCGWHLDYTFNKYQQKLLKKQFKQIIDNEIIYEDKTERKENQYEHIKSID